MPGPIVTELEANATAVVNPITGNPVSWLSGLWRLLKQSPAGGHDKASNNDGGFPRHLRQKVRPKLLTNENRTWNGSTGWKTSVNAAVAVGVIREV